MLPKKATSWQCLKMQTGLQALTAYLKALLILINESEILHKLIFSDVIMTDQFDNTGPQAWWVINTQEAACFGVGRKVGCLTGGTELTAVGNGKALCHSHNVWGNEMNSLAGFLQFAMPKNTVLSAQMEQAWFWRRAWCRLQKSHCEYQWIPEIQTLAGKWQWRKLPNIERIPAVLSDQMDCQYSGQPIQNQENSNNQATPFPGEAIIPELHAIFHLFGSKEGVDNMSWCKP